MGNAVSQSIQRGHSIAKNMSSPSRTRHEVGGTPQNNELRDKEFVESGGSVNTRLFALRSNSLEKKSILLLSTSFGVEKAFKCLFESEKKLDTMSFVPEVHQKAEKISSSGESRHNQRKY